MTKRHIQQFLYEQRIEYYIINDDKGLIVNQLCSTSAHSRGAAWLFLASEIDAIGGIIITAWEPKLVHGFY